MHFSTKYDIHNNASILISCLVLICIKLHTISCLIFNRHKITQNIIVFGFPLHTISYLVLICSVLIHTYLHTLARTSVDTIVSGRVGHICSRNILRYNTEEIGDVELAYTCY